MGSVNYNRKLTPWVFIAFLVIPGVFYFIFDPMDAPFMPGCFFHKLTGLQCMGCGSQRMIHALLHGDFSSAFRANALATLSIPFLAFLLWLELYRTRYPRLYARIYSVGMIYSCGIILCLWMILRNLLSL